MNWVYSIISFCSGAVTVAAINEIVSRLFGAPRVHSAIADITIARSKHRALKSIRVPESLSILLADGPTSQVDWDATSISEHAVDLSVLELLGKEKSYTDEKLELVSRRSRINSHSVKDEVLSLGRNIPLTQTCVNALIRFNDRSPRIPQTTTYPEVFKLHKIRREHEGRELEFVHLDLPGNPFPIVGCPDGRTETNEKSAALAYAMSHCDPDVLNEILALAIQYCETRITECQRLREEFERIKKQKSYLEIQILVSNRGKYPAYVSTFADVKIGNVKDTVRMSFIDESGIIEGTTNWRLVIRDQARRIADWIPSLSGELANFQSGIQMVSVAPSESVDLHFVSDDEISQLVADAVSAMKTGYTDCELTLWQYVPRRIRWLPWAARFIRKIKTIQKTTSVRVNT